MKSAKCYLKGNFTLNGKSITLVLADKTDKSFNVDYIDNETGEVFTEDINKFDDAVQIEICRQFETETGIEVDYRNV